MAKNLVLAKAQNAVLAHDWNTAARLYKELLRGDESNVEYLKELGSIYVKAGEDEKAIPYYDQIITFYPHYIEAMNSLGAIYRRLKRYDESIAILQRALEEGRDGAAVYYNLGFTYKEMGNYDSAIDSFETVISEKSDDVLAYNHLGSIYFTQKNYEKAIISFKRGLQVDPNHPILNYNLARCYEADKNYTEAIRCYEATLKTKPGWTDAIRDFSGLLIKCQNNKQAQSLVEKSIQLHPKDIELLCILGRIFINQFDYDNATATFKKANSIDSNNIKVLLGFSEALEKGAKVEQALEKALEAIEIDPYNKDVRKRYVSTLLSNQHYDQAYENVMSLNEETEEKDPQVLDLCAQYYICRGDETKAKTYHDKIQKVNHHYKDHMLNASDRYVQIGDYDKAENYAKQFVERRSQMPDGYNRLGAIYQAKGDMVNAKANYEKGKKFCEPNVIADVNLKIVNKQIEDNPEKYSFETPAIEVDASEITEPVEEQYIPPSFIGEVVGAEEENAEEQQPEESFDYSQLGDNAPMGEALLEKEDDFWEDFDDDPNAEPKELVDEEDTFDEEENEGFDNDIFDTLGGSDPDEEENEDDGEFDFGALDDSTEVENAQIEGFDSDNAPEEIVPEEIVPEEIVPEEKPAPASEQISESVPEPVVMQMNSALQPPTYQQTLERQVQTAALNSADRAMDAAFMAQKMVQQLAEQQKDFEQSLSEKSEKMIKAEVEKAVDEKIQKSMDTQMEKIMSAEEDNFDDFLAVDDMLADGSVVEESTASSTVSPVDEDSFITVEELAGEEAVPIANPFEELEDDFTLVDDLIGDEAMPIIPTEPEDDFDAVEDFICDADTPVGEVVEEDSFGGVEDFIEETDEMSVEDEFDAVEDFIGDEITPESEPEVEVQSEAAPVAEDDFGVVEDFIGEEEEPEVESECEAEVQSEAAPVAEDDFSGVENFICDEEETVEAVSEEPVLEEDSFDEVDDYIEESAEPELAAEPVEEEKEIPVPSVYADQIELFKTLRVLSNFLPENEKDSFLSCRIRMMIEYIIAKMSGRPGLLITAKALLESGALGEEYDTQLTAEAEDDLSNAMITHVLKYMKTLASSLKDDKLSKALCLSADNILERIQLEDQKSQIF